MAKLRPMPEKVDYSLQCWCHVSRDEALIVRCANAGRCVFYKSGTHPRAQHNREVMIGALTDYFAGLTFRQIQNKWGVSNGYVTNMLARGGIPGRVLDRTARGNELVSRKLIPYAGKE